MAADYKKAYEREKEIAKRYNVKFMVNTDSDIIEALNGQPSRQGFIKKALRYYIANGCPGADTKEGEHKK